MQLFETSGLTKCRVLAMIRFRKQLTLGGMKSKGRKAGLEGGREKRGKGEREEIHVQMCTHTYTHTHMLHTPITALQERLIRCWKVFEFFGRKAQYKWKVFVFLLL